MFRTRESQRGLGETIVARTVLLIQPLAVALMLVVLARAVDLRLRSGPRGAEMATRLVAWAAGAALVQVLCLAAFLELRGRHRESQRSFDRVRQLAHDILASLDQGVVTIDGEGIVTSINSGALGLLGVDFECVGRPLACISSGEVPLAELGRRVTEEHAAVVDLELPLGQGRVLLANACELRDTRGRTVGCVIHIRDVTERMLMKEQMWRMSQFASLSTLAAGLHHEIKNPLTALSIHVQLLDERLRAAGADGPAREAIGVLQAEVRRLNAVLEGFRDFASLRRLSVRPIDVRALLEGVARLMRPQAERQGVRLDVDCGGELPSRVGLDPEKIEQALLNLVVNALEALPGGGAVDLRAEVAGGDLVLEVIDDGPGIPPAVRDHIFQPYVSTKGRGSGLGLALAEKLVRQHGGTIAFRTGGRGTTFRIALPLNGENGAHAAHERRELSHPGR